MTDGFDFLFPKEMESFEKLKSRINGLNIRQFFASIISSNQAVNEELGRCDSRAVMEAAHSSFYSLLEKDKGARVNPRYGQNYPLQVQTWAREELTDAQVRYHAINNPGRSVAYAYFVVALDTLVSDRRREDPHFLGRVRVVYESGIKEYDASSEVQYVLKQGRPTVRVMVNQQRSFLEKLMCK